MVDVENILKDSDSPKKLNAPSIEKINESISQKMHMGAEDTIVEHATKDGINT
ncbi:MAG: hypothetical protein RSE41_09680 [Clostridia bacterium]